MAKVKKVYKVKSSDWPEGAAEIAGVIRRGGIVLFPTETVYGIGARATEEGVAKLADAKNRPGRKPFQLLISDSRLMDQWNAVVTPDAKKLMDKFWPGPLTLVLEVNPDKTPRVLAPSGAAGFRMPDHELCLDFIRRAGGVVAATSANLSGGEEAHTCMEALRALSNRIDAAIDGGAISEANPSTVVSVKGDLVTVLREGAISEKEILAALKETS